MTEEKGQGEKKAEDTPGEKKPDFFESKLFRIITLGIYMGGVGGLGCVLALYYLFIWESKMPDIPILNKKH